MLSNLFMFTDEKSDNSLLKSAYEKYRKGMVRFAESILHDANVAEDVVQDVFIKLLCTAKTWRRLAEDKQKAYLFIAVRNQAITTINKLRCEQKYNNKLINFETDLSDTYYYRDEIDMLYRSESNKKFIRELSCVLSDGLIDILILKYDCNLKNKHISTILNISPQAVAMRDCRLRLKVKEYMEEKQRMGCKNV